jgi:hypothetical protein
VPGGGDLPGGTRSRTSGRRSSPSTTPSRTQTRSTRSLASTRPSTRSRIRRSKHVSQMPITHRAEKADDSA